MPRLRNPLKIELDEIPEHSFHTFLGVTLDCQLRFHVHAQRIKTKASKRLSIIRAVSHTSWGGDRQTLLRIYTSLIRSVLEYNAFLFTYLAPSNQRKLGTIQNSALRLITGALRTSSVVALHADVNLPTLELRSQLSLFRFYLRTQSSPSHPSFECFSVQPSDLRAGAYRSTPPVGVQIHRLSQSYNIDLTSFRIAARPPLTPFWTFTTPHIMFLFSETKTALVPEEIKSKFSEFRATHSSSTFFYTDGSKSEETVGAAYCGESQKSFRLHPFTSIFTAELFAILQVLRHIKSKKILSSIVCSDSKSSLLSIQSISSVKHNIVFRIQHILRSINSAYQEVSFLWIPGHSGIEGNMRADELAKAACDSQRITPIAISPEEAATQVSKAISSAAQIRWDTETKGRHAHNIKPFLKKWPSSSCDNRSKEVVLARLRIGHTRLTHRHILDREPPPICSQCNDPLTVEHILITCPLFQSQRVPLHNFTTMHNLPFSLPVLLGDNHPLLLDKLFTFLIDSNIFHSI